MFMKSPEGNPDLQLGRKTFLLSEPFDPVSRSSIDMSSRFVHDKSLSTFVSIDEQQNTILKCNPPDNCHTCEVFEQNNLKLAPTWLKNDQGIVDGVAYGGNNYHIYDFVLYRSENNGPAHLGYITKITLPVRETATSSPKIYMRCVGRVNTILEEIPIGMIKDEVRIVFFLHIQV